MVHKDHLGDETNFSLSSPAIMHVKQSSWWTTTRSGRVVLLVNQYSPRRTVLYEAFLFLIFIYMSSVEVMNHFEYIC